MLDESDFITVAGIISLRGEGGREASHMVVIVVISVQDSLFVCPFTSLPDCSRSLGAALVETVLMGFLALWLLAGFSQ